MGSNSQLTDVTMLSLIVVFHGLGIGFSHFGILLTNHILNTALPKICLYLHSDI